MRTIQKKIKFTHIYIYIYEFRIQTKVFKIQK